MNEQSIRARANLALRAERAFGLNMLAITQDQPSSETQAPAARSAPPPPRPQAGPSGPGPSSARPPDTDLFGNSKPLAPALELPAFSAPVLNTDQKRAQLKDLNENEVSVCRKCRLCEQRTQTVFGEGSPDARIMFIGEGPGENEDLQGRPFVGRAGELLDKWIAAMGLRREQVYIANIVKCRPPENREPAPDETATCTPYLVKQIEIIRPEVIITLGRPASQYMLQSKNSMGNLRGRWHEWRGIKLLPTYHPAYVLRSYNYQTRSAVWGDLQQVMSHLGLPLPKRAPRE